MHIDEIESLWNKANENLQKRMPLIAALASYLQPEVDPLTKDYDGQNALERFLKLSEGLPLRALNIAVAGIISSIMPVGRKWFRLEADGNDINNYNLAKEIESYVYKKIDKPEMKNIVVGNVIDMLVYGTGHNRKVIDADDKISYEKLPQGTVGLLFNSKKEVIGVALEQETTIAQFQKDFGFIPEKHKEDKLYSNICYKIYAMENYDNDEDSKGTKKKYIEYYFYDKEIIKTIGYKTHPYLICRKNITESGWGLGNGIKALGAIVSLEELMLDFFNALEEQFDPATVTNSKVVKNPNFSKGKKNIADLDTGDLKSAQVYNARKIEYNWEAFQLAYNLFKNTIERMLDADVFLSISGVEKQMTAYETQQLVEEKILRLNGMDSEIRQALVEPIIRDHINSYYEENGIKPSAELKIKYYGVAYDLFRQQELQKYFTAVNATILVGQARGVIGDLVNIDKAVKFIFKSLGFSTSTLLSDEEKAQLRQQAQDTIQQQQSATEQQLGVCSAETQVLQQMSV